jgi:ABC-type Fe3+-hydroxamate transport system substrate-binding protein
MFDQLGRWVAPLQSPPRRVVSLVPSQTELLAYLGLDQEVVGITRFCTHPPEWRRTKTRVGGTKDFRVEQILSLRPDWVLANMEENDRGRIERLAGQVPVWVSNVRCIDSACGMIRSVGVLTGFPERAEALVGRIRAGFDSPTKPLAGRRVLYAIWRQPWMFAGADTFIDAVLGGLGATNAAADWAGRYPTPDLGQLASSAADLLLLSSEPYPFRMRHAHELAAIGWCPPEVRLVDGAHYSWYGPRLVRLFGE